MARSDTDTTKMDPEAEKQLKATEKDIAKTAKAVAKDQDEMDERVVMRSSYNSGAGSGGRFDSGYEYDREA